MKNFGLWTTGAALALLGPVIPRLPLLPIELGTVTVRLSIDDINAMCGSIIGRIATAVISPAAGSCADVELASSALRLALPVGLILLGLAVFLSFVNGRDDTEKQDE
jgi:fumarate reductase subunit D